MKHLVALDEIGISAGFRIDVKDLPARSPRLMETKDGDVLLFTLSRESFTDLVMTFPILNDKDEWNTNWPLRTSFPLFLRNVIHVLANAQESGAAEPIQPGQIVLLRASAAAQQLTVTAPNGTQTLARRGRNGEFSFDATDTIGLYRWKSDEGQTGLFAVSLLDAAESNIQPRPEIELGGKRIRGTPQRKAN